MNKLLALLQDTPFCAHVGAGISTGAGIRDFRGPRGVWTQQALAEKAPSKKKQKEVVPVGPDTPDVPFEAAAPTITHQVLLALRRSGHCSGIVSQNVDGLATKSGLADAGNFVELHGNVYEVVCVAEGCGVSTFLDYDVGGMGRQPTTVPCGKCGGSTRDELLDWHDELVADKLARARQLARDASISLVLGSSMRVQPANEIPTVTLTKDWDESMDVLQRTDDETLAGRKRRRSAARRTADAHLVVVNLAAPPLDNQASLTIAAPCDEVMACLALKFGVIVPSYRREYVAHASLSVAGLITITSHHRMPAPAVATATATATATANDSTSTTLTLQRRSTDRVLHAQFPPSSPPTSVLLTLTPVLHGTPPTTLTTLTAGAPPTPITITVTVDYGETIELIGKQIGITE